jgi:hypothetical protein
MLNRPITSKGLICITGIVFLFLALAHTYQIATGPIYVSSGDQTTKYLLIVWSPGVVFDSAITTGTLLYLAVGGFLLGIGSTRAKWAYWGLQALVWLLGITLWYQASSRMEPFPVEFWPWMGLTLVCSLVLLVLYWPLMRLLRRVLERPLMTASSSSTA